MGGRYIQVNAAHVNMGGHSLYVPALIYRDAASAVFENSNVTFNPIPYFLYCQSLELFLKAFLWAKAKRSLKSLKGKYGHDLEKLWDDSKLYGVHRIAATTCLRDRVISLIGPYYKNRQLTYYDLEFVFSGMSKIRRDAEVLPVLERLTKQFGKSLIKCINVAAHEKETKQLQLGT